MSQTATLNSSGPIPLPPVNLEGWGLSRDELGGIVEALNQECSYLEWSAETANSADSLTLHLVDFGALAGPRNAVWNTFGPIEAMRSAIEAGRPALALCSGRSSRLPAVRRGLWTTLSERPWIPTIESVVRALAATAWTEAGGYRAMKDWASVRSLTDLDLLAVSAHIVSSDEFDLVVNSALATSITRPVAMTVAGASPIEMDSRLTGELSDPDLFYVAPSTLDGARRVDTLLCFDWPVRV